MGDAATNTTTTTEAKAGTPPKLDEATVRALAVVAQVDPKSIRKVARGEAVRGMSGARAKAAVDGWRRQQVAG